MQGRLVLEQDFRMLSSHASQPCRSAALRIGQGGRNGSRAELERTTRLVVCEYLQRRTALTDVRGHGGGGGRARSTNSRQVASLPVQAQKR